MRNPAFLFFKTLFFCILTYFYFNYEQKLA